MNRLSLFALLSLGCAQHGVSVGTEELCVLDARLAGLSEPGGENVSNCAVLGDNQLDNSSFETPLVMGCEHPSFCQFPVAQVPGWSTSSAEQVVEIWKDGHESVTAPDGGQFGELDARSRDTLYQDVALEPGQLMYWSLVHRGRTGIDSMDLRIGPPDATSSQRVLSSAEDAWYPYSGLYRAAADETLTRFALVSRNGEEAGNLVDAVVFAPVD